MQFFKLNFKIFSYILFLALVVNNKAHSFYIGPLVEQEKYREILTKPLKSKEKGTLYGFKGGIEYKKAFYARADVEYSEGQTNYFGTRYNFRTKKTTFCNSLTSNALLNLEADLGLVFKVKNFHFIPYWGFGFNYWARDLEKYSEIYRFCYFPFGAFLECCFFSIWDIGIKPNVMPTKIASIELRNFSPSTMSLENRWQYGIDLYTKIRIKKVKISFGAFYRNLDLGPSKRKTSFSSPSSKKTMIGEDLLLEFCF